MFRVHYQWLTIVVVVVNSNKWGTTRFLVLKFGYQKEQFLKSLPSNNRLSWLCHFYKFPTFPRFLDRSPLCNDYFLRLKCFTTKSKRGTLLTNKNSTICNCLAANKTFQNVRHQPLLNLRNSFIILRNTKFGSFDPDNKPAINRRACMFCSALYHLNYARVTHDYPNTFLSPITDSSFIGVSSTGLLSVLTQIGVK